MQKRCFKHVTKNHRKNTKIDEKMEPKWTENQSKNVRSPTSSFGRTMSLQSVKMIQKSIKKTFDVRRRRSHEQRRSSDRGCNVRRCDRDRNVRQNISFT